MLCLGRTRIYVRNGLFVEHESKKFALDPQMPVNSDYVFYSHAHLDHMSVPRESSRVFSSAETRLLASVRGYELGETLDHSEGVRLLDSGHILGARALSLAEEFLYTGDAAGRPRAFLSKCRTRKAKTLLMETTFGSSEYIFPPTANLLKQVNGLIAEIFDKGRPVVLMGYPLGKAQVLTYLFSSWGPMFFHEQVAQINEIYLGCGIALKQGPSVNSSSISDLPQGPWIMVAPMMNHSTGFVSALKKRHGAVTMAFSGWARGEGYRLMMGADHAFPLSDHCDYSELLQLVHDVSPEVVYTTHGFAEEFARDLRREGFDAKPIAGYQSNLSDF